MCVFCSVCHLGAATQHKCCLIAKHLECRVTMHVCWLRTSLRPICFGLLFRAAQSGARQQPQHLQTFCTLRSRMTHEGPHACASLYRSACKILRHVWPALQTGILGNMVVIASTHCKLQKLLWHGYHGKLHGQGLLDGFCTVL